MINHSPKIVTDGLVMCLDPSLKKSYPTDLSVKDGLALWLDAADDSTFSYSSGTSISQWRDKSGNSFHASQSTVVNQPNRSTIRNSRKTVFFDGTDDTFTISNFTCNSEMSIFVVSDCGNSLLIEHSANANNNSGFYFYGGGGGMFLIKRNNSSIISYSNWLSGGYSIASGLNSTGLDLLTYKDGTQQSITSDGRNSIDNSYTTTTLYIGSRGASSIWSIGSIAEIIIYNRKVSDIERKSIHTYLGQKWGINNTDRSIIDLSGNGNDGLLGNGTTANMPVFDYYNNGSFKFDGTNDYMSVTRTLSVPMTICGFIKYVDQGKSYNTFINGYPHNTIAISLNRNGAGNIQIFLGNGSAWVGAPAISYTSLSVDTWYHITFTCDGTTSTLYINGVTVATSNIIPSGFGSYFYLGHLTGGVSSAEYLKGNLAGVQLYTIALTSTQVLQNYEAQKSRYAVSLVQQGLVLNLDAGNPYSYAGAGSTIYDVSPTALSWTINNATYNSDPIKYFSYNGSNCWLQSSTSSAYDSQTITMECWCLPSSLSQNGFLFEKGQVNTQYSMFLSTGPAFIFRTINLSNQDLSFTPSSYLSTSRWNHIVCTYGSGTKTIYVNGVQVAQQTGLTGTIPTGQTNQYIGKYGSAGNNYPFNGSIAESRVYNIALSAAQVVQNYNATKGKFGIL